MTRAIFIDRKHKLTRCQLLGMNQKGEPEWLVIEQGMVSKTLAAIQREDFIDHRYGMLCLEGEKLDKLTLMRILASAIVGEIKGYGFGIDDIPKFVDDMKKHQVEWPRDRVGLRFSFNPDFEHTGKYVLSVYLGCRKEEILMLEDNIEDPNDWWETIHEFCCMLEDEVGMHEPYKELELSSVDDVEIDENDLYMFNRVIRKD